MQIERLALDILTNPGLPKPAHIDACEFCRSIFVDFTEFYKQTHSEFRSIDAVSLEKLVDQKLHPNEKNTYRFDALHLMPSVQSNPLHKKILAADSEISIQSQSIRNIGVFTSSDERLMVRVLKARDGDYSLFLLSESKELYQNVLVRIVGYEGDYISDMNGAIKLGKIDLPDSDKLGIEVRTTTETYDLKNYFPGVDSLIGENEISVEHSQDRRYRMEIFSVDGKFNLKVTITEMALENGRDHVKVMVVKNETHTEVKSFEKGMAIFEDIQDPADLQLKIFT